MGEKVERDREENRKSESLSFVYPFFFTQASNKHTYQHSSRIMRHILVKGEKRENN